MKQMKRLAFLLISTIIFSYLTHASEINPQPGDSVWDIVNRIGQHTDDTSSSFTTIQSIEIKVDVIDAEIEALAGGIINIGTTGSTYTINTSGRYQLVAHRTNPIVIDADNVCLDLACFKISVASDVDGITVNGGANKEYISIHNGIVCKTGGGFK